MCPPISRLQFGQLTCILANGHSRLLLFALFCGFVALTFAQPAKAAVEGVDCGPEPTTDQLMAYGDVRTGGNCAINPNGDLDSFVFQGSLGDQIRLVLTRTGFSGTPCVELRDPDNEVVVNETCALVSQLDETLAKSGLYKLFVTESGNNNIFSYNVSLERLFPIRSPTAVGTGQVVSDAMVSPVGDIDTYRFINAAADDELRIIVTRTGFSGIPCVELRDPVNNVLVPETCGVVVQLDEMLATPGLHQIIVTEQGHDNIFNHNVSLQCISGVCPMIPPVCEVDLGFDSGTLTIDFQLATPEPANWSFGISSLAGRRDLYSVNLPMVDPPVSFALPVPNFPGLGNILIWSGLATTAGITCYDFDTVDTGPLGSAARSSSRGGRPEGAPTIEQIQDLFRQAWPNR